MDVGFVGLEYLLPVFFPLSPPEFTLKRKITRRRVDPLSQGAFLPLPVGGQFSPAKKVCDGTSPYTEDVGVKKIEVKV